jgi:hypothetical protein
MSENTLPSVHYLRWLFASVDGIADGMDWLVWLVGGMHPLLIRVMHPCCC